MHDPSARFTGTTSAGTPRRLDRRARIALDAARAASALYVVVYHLAQQWALPGLIRLFFGFGQEAVIVFFLLSGFVIFVNERERVRQPGGYYLRRLRRIYPPILVAMSVSTALSVTGLIALRPDLRSAVSTLLSVQDISRLKPGVISDPYLLNDPLWSLSYEVFFYLVFPLVMIAWRRSIPMTRLLVPMACTVAYVVYLAAPNHLALVGSYFILWWAGAMAAHVYTAMDGTERPTAVARRLRPELAGVVALLIAALSGVAVFGFHGIGVFPVLPVRHIAVALVLLLLAATPLRRRVAALALPVARPITVVASLSYGLYVLHYPLLVQTGVAHTLLLLPAAAGTVAAAWLTDVGLGRLLGRRTKPAVGSS